MYGRLEAMSGLRNAARCLLVAHRDCLATGEPVCARTVAIATAWELRLVISPDRYYLDCDCPWCGERLEMTIDCSAGDQDYIEDCQICCAPILVTVRMSHYDPAVPDVWLRREDD